jgi:type II secretory pathway component PulF
VTAEEDKWALDKIASGETGEVEVSEEPEGNWLSGLVDKEKSPETDGSGWLSGLVNESSFPVGGDPELPEPEGGNWLSGLVSPDSARGDPEEDSLPHDVPIPEPEISGEEAVSPGELPMPTPEVKPEESKPEARVDKPVAATPKPIKVEPDLSPPKPVSKATERLEKAVDSPKKAPLPLDFAGPVSAPRVPPPTVGKKPPTTEPSETAEGPQEPLLAPRVTGRQMVTFYRSLSVMLSSGIQLFACFEFLSRDAESKELSAACKRIGQRLVEGYPLPRAVAPERSFFDNKTVRLLEVGYKSGALNKILKRLAEDQEASWKLESQLQSQLYYPLGIAALGTLGVLVLPPLVLNDLLQQVVKFTDEPPAITQALLNFSAFLSSPWTIGLAVVLIIGLGFFIRTPYWTALKRRLEIFYWEIPGISELWQSVVAVRFLSVFALTDECGLPATHCLLLSSGATGSTRVEAVGPVMKETLVAGGTLRETLEAGNFLPSLVLEAVEAGQQTGKVADLLQRSADILSAEVQNRIEMVAKLVEPLVLTILGFFVGLFALGCLLPIIGLVEKI